MTRRVGSLCSGYGGLEMGLLEALGGGEVAWHAEYDDAPAAVLAHHWPDVPNLRDITTVDWSTPAWVEWLCAGYPCQPFSNAGKRKGTSDERHLWPYVGAAIGAIRPRRVLLENVAGHLTLGLDVVLGDLAALGYDAVWGVVRASDAGAPHGRARVFIVAADTADDGCEWGRLARGRGPGPANHDLAAAADPDGAGSQGGEPEAGRELPAWGPYEPAIRRWAAIVGRRAPLPVEPGRNGPRLAPAFVEWLMGLPPGHVTGVPGLSRAAQLKALGNGVVPAQAALAVRVLLPILERELAA